MVYHISLYENGRFCSHIGGELRILADAVAQLKEVAAGLQATELEDYHGVKFDRNGTDCALLVTDAWTQPIKNIKED